MPFMSVNDLRPRFTFTPSIVRYLMEIEGAREVVAAVPLPAGIEATLRRRAKISSAHFSTKIEQNTLTYTQVEAVESNADRSRDASTQEVRNYLRALQWIHDHAARQRITSQLFQQLHAMIEVRSQGRRPKQSPYRRAQNTVRDDRTGAIAYLPPEPKDVANLANALVSRGRLDEAITCYRSALQLDPNSPVLHFDLSVALSRQGNAQDAEAERAEAQRLKGGRPQGQ